LREREIFFLLSFVVVSCLNLFVKSWCGAGVAIRWFFLFFGNFRLFILA